MPLSRGNLDALSPFCGKRRKFTPPTNRNMMTLLQHTLAIPILPKDELFMSKLTDGLFKDIHQHHLSPTKIARITLNGFFDSGDQMVELRNNFAHLYGQAVGKSVPALSFFAPKPGQSKAVTLAEVMYLPADGAGVTQYKKYTSEHYVIHRHGAEALLISGSVSFFRHEHHSLDHSQRALDFAEQLLDHEELPLNAIRYMNTYIAHLDRIEHLLPQHQTHAQSFEQIKNTYFQLYDWPNGLPAIEVYDAPFGGTSIDLIACVNSNCVLKECPSA